MAFKSNILKVNKEVYMVLPDGKHDIKLVKVLLFETAQGKEMLELKFRCLRDKIKDKKIYSVTISNNQTATTSVGQLIRAVSPEEVEELDLDALKGQMLTIELVGRGTFQNVVSITPFLEDKEDHSEDEESSEPEGDEMDDDKEDVDDYEEEDNEEDDEEEEPVPMKKKRTTKTNMFRELNKSSRK